MKRNDIPKTAETAPASSQRRNTSLPSSRKNVQHIFEDMQGTLFQGASSHAPAANAESEGLRAKNLVDYRLRIGTPLYEMSAEEQCIDIAMIVNGYRAMQELANCMEQHHAHYSKVVPSFTEFIDALRNAGTYRQRLRLGEPSEERTLHSQTKLQVLSEGLDALLLDHPYAPDRARVIGFLGCVMDADAARSQLCRANLALVYSFASQLSGPTHSMEECVSSGSVGLLQAIETFDPQRGAFSEHLSRCIHQHICRDRQRTSMNIPTYVLDLFAKFNETQATLEKGASIDEVIQHMWDLHDTGKLFLNTNQQAKLRSKFFPAQITAYQQHAHQHVSFTRLDEKDSLHEPSSTEWEQQQKRKEDIADMLFIMKVLEPREQAIVQQRFGFGEEEEAKTLLQIAEQLRLSRERVRQIERIALQKLRDALKDDTDSTTP